MPEDIQPTPESMIKDGRVYLVLVDVGETDRRQLWNLIRWGRPAVIEYRAGWVDTAGIGMKCNRVIRFYELDAVLKTIGDEGHT